LIVKDSVRELNARERYYTNYDRQTFSGLFVLYASEYFRQNYSGLEWAGVLKSVEIYINQDRYQNLYKCIERGLKEWNRDVDQKISDAGGRKWLGTLILEGGLPLPMLTDRDCPLGSFLISIIDRAKSRGAEVDDIAKWIELSKDKLRKTYQNETFYQLLAEFVWTVLHLKSLAEITDPQDILGQLDAFDKNWRYRFPLRVDDDQTTKLLQSLLEKTIATPRAFQFSVVRELKKTDEIWQLKSSIAIPEAVESISLCNVFLPDSSKENGDPLPRILELSLVNGNLPCFFRRAAGAAKYRADRAGTWDAYGADAVGEQLLRLKTIDGQAWAATATKGDALDADLPWLFELSQDGIRFVRQGCGGVASETGMVAIPEHWHIDDPVTLVGKIPSLRRSLYTYSGSITLDDGDGSRYRLSTGKGTGDGVYVWQGDRVWQEFLSPTLAYRGLPKLYIMDADGNRKLLGRPMWNPRGDKSRQVGEPLGPGIALYKDSEGSLLHRSRILVLPQGASISYQFVDAHTGIIQLKNWAAKYATTDIGEVKVQPKVDGDNLNLTLTYGGDSYPPEHVELEIEWENTVETARLRLPFPLRGARSFDQAGQPIKSGTNIPIEKLPGIRMLALNGSQGNHPKVVLELTTGGVSITPVDRTIDGLQAEFRLHDYRKEIEHLLSIDDRPEAAVNVSLRVGGKEEFKFRITRHASSLEKDGAYVRLDQTMKEMSTEGLADMQVMAILLERAGTNPFRLHPVLSQGIATGTWEFYPHVQESGSWLIFSAHETPTVCPFVWNIPGEAEAMSDLGRALGIDSRKARQIALDEVIAKMVADYSHPDWIKVEELAKSIGHLPLPFFDLWRRFARAPEGMTALAMRIGDLPADFVSRFDKELPFAWEAVPYVAWVNAINLLERQCKAQAFAAIFQAHLDNVICKFTESHRALNFSLIIAQAAAANDTSKLNSLCQQAPRMADDILFSDDNGCIQRMRRDHSEDTWPDEYIERTRDFRLTSPHKGIMCNQSFGFHDGIINYPILLAYYAATGATREMFTPENFHALRIHQGFDPEWFNEAYDWTIARCLALGLLQLEVSK